MPSATDDQIVDALKKANSWDFLINNKLTLDSDVGASGSQLSGGQKQRMAIARAFIKKPKILVLDEATSALDKNNEKIVQQAINDIKRELGDVTTIVIAHRLSTIQDADKILVMSKGKIIEEGNH
jgi:ABC-type multidrug transport system fused ATPase/permease subunit